MDNGHRPDDGLGEAWDPEDERGEGAWDDGSEEVWDEAEFADGVSAEDGLREHAGNDEELDDGPHTALPAKVEAWRRRSATGAILTGFAFGLQQVFEPKQDDPAVIMETSGEPPKDLPVEADFEYGRPRSSVVNIRPWLLPGEEQVAGQPEERSRPGQSEERSRPGQSEEQPGRGQSPAGEDDERPEP